MRFYGNEICCGSYACLNAMGDSTIDLQLFEISTSAPFGIRHCEDKRFDRLLTTYRDPNAGLDRALQLWGYHVENSRFHTTGEVLENIKALIAGETPIIIGPVDMGRLGYQVMPSILKRMDHYIVVEGCSDAEIFCTDSEGYVRQRIEKGALCSYLSVAEIPEADGSLTVRRIEKERAYCIEEILRKSLRYASENLSEAEAQKEGASAIIKCCEYLIEQEEYKWRLPLLYDIQYLKQRKLLLLLLADMLEKYELQPAGKFTNLKEYAMKQNDLLGELYWKLRSGEGLDRRLFAMLAELERKVCRELCQGLESHDILK